MSFQDSQALMALKTQFDAEKPVIEGYLRTTSRGFGFLNHADGDDIFIPKPLLKGMLPDSKITALVDENDKGQVVQEIKKAEGGRDTFHCRVSLVKKGGSEFTNAIPLDRDFDALIRLGRSGDINLNDGDIVYVQVKQELDARIPHLKGTVIDVIGHESQPETMREFAKSKFSLNAPLTGIEVKSIPDVSNYTDWTDKAFVTIDAWSSKDLDDALYVSEDDDNWYLHIAIADPTLIFKCQPELRYLFISRGVTHYLNGEVIHLMMPSYSEHCFSLLPMARPAIGGIIPVSKQTGALGDIVFSRVMIRSRAKLSYEQVQSHLEHAPVAEIDSNAGVCESLNLLDDMSAKRGAYRHEHHLPSVNSPDFNFVMENNEPVGVRQVTRKRSHSMVEEAAIAANIALARWGEANDVPLVYSTHAGFDETKREKIIEYVTARGLLVSDDWSMSELFTRSHRFFAEKIASLTDTSSAYEIALANYHFTELRAFYEGGKLSLKPKAHAPMGLSSYATWTSPIRKAQDMFNHLMIKQHIDNGQHQFPEDLGQMDDILDIIQERVSSSRKGERLLNKLLGVRYLTDITTCEAVIAGITKRALRLIIEGTDIGFSIPLRTLSKDAEVDTVNQKVRVGSSEEYLIGQRVWVNITDLDVYTQTISASIVESKILADE